MAFIEKSWNVEYGGSITKDAWTMAFKRLHFVQNVRNKPSQATHVFQCYFQRDSVGQAEVLMQEAAKLKFSQEIEFNLCSREGTPERGTKHFHVIYDWNFRVTDSGFLLVVKTMDRLALATIESKNRAHNGNLEEIVESILASYGISLFTEPCKEVEHFKTLLQRNLTDMQFILHEVLPRSVNVNGVGGYSLFSKDGKEAFYQTLNYKLPTPFKPAPESIVGVTEAETNYRAAKLGGMVYTVHGFNPFTKKPIVVRASPDTAPSQGSHGPKIPQASRYDYVPLQTEDAVTAWANERQGTNSFEAYPMTAVFKGSTALDLPMQIDFSDTKFRQTCTQVVPVVQIRHLLTNGRLSQTVTMLRDKMLL